jgi:hypothetical protein
MVTVKVSLSKAMEGDFNPAAHNYFNHGTGEFSSLTKIITTRTWSPIVFKDGYRTKKNFLESQIVALDFDDGRWTLQDAEGFAQDYNFCYIIGLTKSHQKEKVSKTSGEIKPPCDRFRLIILANEPTTSRDDYEYTMHQLMQTIPCDRSCKDGARYFFPCSEVYRTNFDGGAIAWWKAPPKVQVDEDRKAKWHQENGTIPSWVVKAVKEGSSTRHKTCYSIGAELSKIGYTDDEIVEYILTGPMRAIGAKDVERAVRNGREAAKEGRWSLS